MRPKTDAAAIQQAKDASRKQHKDDVTVLEQRTEMFTFQKGRLVAYENRGALGLKAVREDMEAADHG